MGASIDKFLWEIPEIKNRVLECDVISEKILKIIRIIGLILMTQIILLAYIGDEETQTSGLLFFTIWGAFCCFFLYLFYAICYLFPDCTFLWKLTHLIFIVTISCGICIFIVFWGIIIPYIFIDGSIEISVFDIILNIEVHGINYVYVLIDFYFNRIEFAWAHYVVMIIYGIAYCILNAVYTRVKDSEIYPGVDWKSWFTALFIFIAVLSTTLAFIGFKKIANIKRTRYIKDDDVKNKTENDNKKEDKKEEIMNIR